MSNPFGRRLAWAEALCLAIAACEPEDAVFVLEAVLHRMRAGAPVAYFLSVAAEARGWAALAAPYERRAYAVAALSCMSPSERAGVLHLLQRGQDGRC